LVLAIIVTIVVIQATLFESIHYQWIVGMPDPDPGRIPLSVDFDPGYPSTRIDQTRQGFDA
jgi:hypothetical protein